MRAFLAACLVAVVLAACGVLGLGALQEPSGAAFSTAGVRIEPSWNWRHMFGQVEKPAGQGSSGEIRRLAAEDCNRTRAYMWVLVDFGETAGAPCFNQ
jgi:Tfp pilus assembly protein PilV